jgi:protein disulfide-isomerase A1
MRPEYIKAAKLLMDENSEVRLAKVNVKVETGLKFRFSIRGIPTFKFFINGKQVDYKGAHTAEDLVTWLKLDHGEEL